MPNGLKLQNQEILTECYVNQIPRQLKELKTCIRVMRCMALTGVHEDYKKGMLREILEISPDDQEQLQSAFADQDLNAWYYFESRLAQLTEPCSAYARAAEASGRLLTREEVFIRLDVWSAEIENLRNRLHPVMKYNDWNKPEL